MQQLWRNIHLEESTRSLGEVSCRKPVTEFCSVMCRGLSKEGAFGVSTYGFAGLSWTNILLPPKASPYPISCCILEEISEKIVGPAEEQRSGNGWRWSPWQYGAFRQIWNVHNFLLYYWPNPPHCPCAGISILKIIWFYQLSWQCKLAIVEIRKLTFWVLALPSDKGLTLKGSPFDPLYGGQFTLSTQLIKPD